MLGVQTGFTILQTHPLSLTPSYSHPVSPYFIHSHPLSLYFTHSQPLPSTFTHSHPLSPIPSHPHPLCHSHPLSTNSWKWNTRYEGKNTIRMSSAWEWVKVAGSGWVCKMVKPLPFYTLTHSHPLSPCFTHSHPLSLYFTHSQPLPATLTHSQPLSPTFTHCQPLPPTPTFFVTLIHFQHIVGNEIQDVRARVRTDEQCCEKYTIRISRKIHSKI